MHMINRPNDCAALRRFLWLSSMRLGGWARAEAAEHWIQASKEQIPAEIANHTTYANALEIGEALTQSGCVSLGALLTEDQAAETRAYFQGRPAYPGHTKFNAHGAASCRWDDPSPNVAQTSYESADIFAAPHVLDLILNPMLQAAAQSYLNVTPTLYAVNAFWSLPNRSNPVYNTQTGHRDLEMLRTFSVFIFLTPQMHTEDGAHVYVPGSHHPQRFKEQFIARGANPTDQDVDAFFQVDGADWTIYDGLDDSYKAFFTGPAGTGFVTDPYGLHVGMQPISEPRLVLWLRWGVHEMWEGIAETPYLPQLRSVIPDTPRQNYIHRLYLSK